MNTCQMKKILFVFLSLFVLSLVSAQENFNTGNYQLDIDLNEINTNAKVDLKKFCTELKTSFNISDEKLEYMQGDLKMAPVEMYFALEVSSVSKRPIDDVLKSYVNNKSRGWGYIAQQVGVKPGSDEFKTLVNNSNNQKDKIKENSSNKGKSSKKERNKKESKR